MAKILEMSMPPQTATKTKVNTLTIAGIAVMVLTTTALMGFFANLAATSIYNLGQAKTDFGYEIHDLATIGDYGTVYNVTHEWKRVEFLRAERGLKPYAEYLDAQGNTLPPPVVITQPLSYKGVQPAHVRIKNVTNTGFDLKIEEWGYMDGVHVKENVSFLVWPTFSLYDNIVGFGIEAGTIKTDQEWSEIKLSLDFKNYLKGQEPVIFTQSQTYNGGDPIVTRNKTVSNIPAPPATTTTTTSPSSLYGKVVKNPLFPEVLYYIGYDSRIAGYGRFAFPYLLSSPDYNTFDSWYPNQDNVLSLSNEELIKYPIRGNVTYRPGTKLLKISTDSKIFVVEPGGILRYIGTEESAELLTKIYGLNWKERLLVVPDSFFVNYSLGLDWTAINKHPEGTLIQYSGSGDIYLIKSGQKRKFIGTGFAENRYKGEYLVKDVNPAVFIYPDGQPISGAEKELLNVAGQIPPVSLCKDSDGGNNYYIKGTASKPGSSLVDICTNRIGETYTYTESCSGSSCYLQEAYCDNNKDIVTSIAYVCPLGCGLGACVSDKIYQARLQEEEAKGAHVVETIGYIAIKPFTGMFGGDKKVEVGTIKAGSGFTLLPFQIKPQFEGAPAFIAHIQSFNGGDTAGLRYKELDNLKAYVKVEEEQSKDVEMNHTAETIGYIAISRPVQVVGKLNVSLSDKPYPQKVLAGTTNFDFANLIFDATDSPSDLQVSQVKVTITTGNGGFPANLSNSTLWDGNIQLMPTNDPDFDLNITTPGASTIVIFTLSSPLTIPAGASKTLTYKANISSAAVSGAEISAGIQPGAEPAVKDAGGNKVSPSVSYSAGQKMVVITSGELFISEEAGSIPPMLMSANLDQFLMGKFQALARFEDIRIEKIYLTGQQVNNGGWDQIDKVYIYNQSDLLAEIVPTTTDGVDKTILLDLTSKPIIVSKDWSVYLIIKGDTADSNNLIGSKGASGQGIKIKIASGNDVTAKGVLSGIAVKVDTINAITRPFYLFRGVPTLTPNDRLFSGERITGGTLPLGGVAGANLYRFKVTASGADVGLYYTTFGIQTSGNVAASNFKLWDGGELIAQTLYAANGEVQLISHNIWTIPAGTTRTFTLRADVNCSGPCSGSLIVSQLGDPAFPNPLPASIPQLDPNSNFGWTDFWQNPFAGSSDPNAINLPQWIGGYLVPLFGGGTMPPTSTPVVFSNY